VDALAVGKSKRRSTLDVIGAGPRAIAGVLENFNLEPRITTVNTLRKINLREFDVLFISGMTSDLRVVRKIIKRWRKKSKKPVIIGGPITSAPIRSFRKTGADIGVMGEGEETLEYLLNDGLIFGELPNIENLEKIRGITFRSDKNLIFTGFRPVLSKVKFLKLKPSTRVIRDYPLYYASRVYVEILRGCSNFQRSIIYTECKNREKCRKCFEGSLDERKECPDGVPPGCGYCSVPSLYGSSKSRTVKSITDEIRCLIDEGVQRIVLSAPWFLDYGREKKVEPYPLTDPRYPEPNYEEVKSLLSKLNNIDEIYVGQVSLMIENLKSVLVTEKAAEILGKYLKGTSVNIGFETGSALHSCQLGRPSTPEEVYNSIDRLNRVGMNPYVYFIHGLPGQTKETIESTVNAIKKSSKLGASRIILYRFKSLPMSAFSKFPSGPPGKTDRNSKIIHDVAAKVNKSSKKEMIGSILPVVIAEQYNRNNRYMIAYPMNHGPVVLLENADSMEGKIVNVIITSLASERMVYGKIESLCFKERVKSNLRVVENVLK
jgi:radical SAM superfamily enzyme YgiQ (UPF0313 family)